MNRDGGRDYSLLGRDSERAQQHGLVAAEWYHSDVPRARMKALMRRRDGPAVTDTAIWLALLGATGFGGYWFWGSVWCVPCFIAYGVLYGSASDSRWHETGHGTAFRTSWLNDAIYQLASFMNMKEPTLWRWSHARHHTDTIIVGRDREILAMRPPDAMRLVLNVVGIPETIAVARSVGRHARGLFSAEEMDFIPATERPRVRREALAWVVIYAAVTALAVAAGTWLPFMFVGLPSLYGRWLAHYFAFTQHAGLAENVLDHRLNSRTVYMNPLLRFLYWNMNYHVEHHMFPMVPYHALRELHAELREDLPAPCPSSIAAYREILPTLWRQRHDPEYHLEPTLPPGAKPFRPELHPVAVEA